MRIAYFGTPDFAIPALQKLLDSRHEIVLVVAQPDRPVGRGMNVRKPPVAALAVERGVPLAQPEKIDEAFVGRVRELKADLAVVVAYGKILPPTLLEAVPGGFVNVHASLLPAWRGAAPVQRSIAAGETVTGVSIMRIDEELDHGPVFAMREIATEPEERAPSIFARLAEAGGDLLLEVLDQIEGGTAVERPQNHAEATLARKIRKDEGDVDWREPADVLFNRFRAFDPWPGLNARVQGERLRLADIRGVDPRSGKAGEVLALEGDGAIVAAGEGSLVVRSIQRPGRRAADASDVLRGMRIGPGDILE